MTQWIRLWEDMPNDPKWRVVAKRARRPVSEVLAVFVHMLTQAGASAERGSLTTWDDEDVATAIDAKPEHVTAIRMAMQGKTLDGQRLSGWENRQPIREDGSAERAAARRERIRIEKLAAEAQRSLDLGPGPPETGQTACDRMRPQPTARREERRLEENITAAAATRVDAREAADLDPELVDPVPDPDRELEAECRGLVDAEPCLIDPGFPRLLALRADGITDDDIRTGVREAMARARPDYRFRWWRDFETWIRKAAQNRLAAVPRPVVLTVIDGSAAGPPGYSIRAPSRGRRDPTQEAGEELLREIAERRGMAL